MVRMTAIIGTLVVGALVASPVGAEDRVASVAKSSFSTEPSAAGGDSTLVDLIHALDKATHSSTKIVLRPFARSLKDTADGLADFHIPFIQDDNLPPPEGLLYVTEVDFGRVQQIGRAHV